jgi:uncharacterized protein (DUF2336 family)
MYTRPDLVNISLRDTAEVVRPLKHDSSDDVRDEAVKNL